MPINIINNEVQGMKNFEQLFSELQYKIKVKDLNSKTVKELEEGVHYIGKKIVEEAAEVWMAAEYEGKEKTAQEISQLLYHLQVMMIACNISPKDVYQYL